MKKIRLNRKEPVFTCDNDEGLGDLQMAEILKKRLRVGNLVQWGGGGNS